MRGIYKKVLAGSIPGGKGRKQHWQREKLGHSAQPRLQLILRALQNPEPLSLGWEGGVGARPLYLGINQAAHSSHESCPWAKRLSAAQGKSRERNSWELPTANIPSSWGNKGFSPEGRF